LKVKAYDISLGERTCIMGVLNITPDSFSDGGKYLDKEKAVQRAMEMARGGADIIDIGGESSRPGAVSISAAEEIERVIPVVEALIGKIEVPISVDTRKSEVAKEALSKGASFINDITALRADGDMAKVIADFDAGCILMHMKGDPENMQDAPHYDDVIGEISAYLAESIKLAEDSGIDPGKIIIDPGIGFGKTLEHNLLILKNLERFKELDKPIMVGTSRKSFIGKLTGKEADERIFGTAASIAAAILNGADIVRVHDVPQMREVSTIADSVKRAG